MSGMWGVQVGFYPLRNMLRLRFLDRACMCLCLCLVSLWHSWVMPCRMTLEECRFSFDAGSDLGCFSVIVLERWSVGLRLLALRAAGLYSRSPLLVAIGCLITAQPIRLVQTGPSGIS